MTRSSARKRSTDIASESPSESRDMEAHLFDCALTEFAEKGYDATSVRDIIRRAGVTQPTLYYYCRGKLDLFERLVRGLYAKSLHRLRQASVSGESCRERLAAMMAESFAECLGDPRVPRLMFQTAFGPVIADVTALMEKLASERFGVVRRVIEAGIASGELQPTDADGLTLAFCCLMDQHINLLVRQPRPDELLTPELAVWLVALFFQGAGALRT